jgi:hypothetical protein
MILGRGLHGTDRGLGPASGFWCLAMMSSQVLTAESSDLATPSDCWPLKKDSAL